MTPLRVVVPQSWSYEDWREVAHTAARYIRAPWQGDDSVAAATDAEHARGCAPREARRRLRIIARAERLAREHGQGGEFAAIRQALDAFDALADTDD